MSDDASTLSIFLAHRPRLIDYARRIVGDHARAEDVVQEAYLRFDSAAGSQPFDQPIAYLYRIVRNLALDGRRRDAREGGFLVSSASAQADVAADSRPSPEVHAAGRSDLAALRGAIADLPLRARLALQLHRIEGRSVKEVAQRLGISVGSAHALIVDSLEYCRGRVTRGH
jgi:RNA polymerase sigma-70 factor (ECF subfamily)